jgi:hypothetical protein
MWPGKRRWCLTPVMLVAATARMLVSVLGLRLRLRVRLLRLWWRTRFGARLRMKLLTRRLLRLRLRPGFRMQLRRRLHMEIMRLLLGR